MATKKEVSPRLWGPLSFTDGGEVTYGIEGRTFSVHSPKNGNTRRFVHDAETTLSHLSLGLLIRAAIDKGYTPLEISELITIHFAREALNASKTAEPSKRRSRKSKAPKRASASKRPLARGKKST